MAVAIGLLLSTRGYANVINAYRQINLVANDPSYHPQIVDPYMRDAWGIALRPPGAGGHIWVSNAFTGTSSEYIGDVNGQPLHQDGLTIVSIDTAAFADRGVAFVTGQVYNAASDLPNQPVEFPVAGPEEDGLFGKLTAVPEPSALAILSPLALLRLARRTPARLRQTPRTPLQ
jgi:hypothetical protein